MLLSCYTYKVEMIVQVLAENLESSQLILDDRGGYVTERKTEYLDSVAVYEGKL
jgi:hypothetical protein